MGLDRILPNNVNGPVSIAQESDMIFADLMKPFKLLRNCERTTTHYMTHMHVSTISSVHSFAVVVHKLGPFTLPHDPFITYALIPLAKTVETEILELRLPSRTKEEKASAILKHKQAAVQMAARTNTFTIFSSKDSDGTSSLTVNCSPLLQHRATITCHSTWLAQVSAAFNVTSMRFMTYHDTRIPLFDYTALQMALWEISTTWPKTIRDSVTYSHKFRALVATKLITKESLADVTIYIRGKLFQNDYELTLQEMRVMETLAPFIGLTCAPFDSSEHILWPCPNQAAMLLKKEGMDGYFGIFYANVMEETKKPLGVYLPRPNLPCIKFNGKDDILVGETLSFNPHSFEDDVNYQRMFSFSCYHILAVLQMSCVFQVPRSSFFLIKMDVENRMNFNVLIVIQKQTN